MPATRSTRAANCAVQAEEPAHWRFPQFTVVDRIASRGLYSGAYSYLLWPPASRQSPEPPLLWLAVSGCLKTERACSTSSGSPWVAISSSTDMAWPPLVAIARSVQAASEPWPQSAAAEVDRDQATARYEQPLRLLKPPTALSHGCFASNRVANIFELFLGRHRQHGLFVAKDLAFSEVGRTTVDELHDFTLGQVPG